MFSFNLISFSCTNLNRNVTFFCRDFEIRDIFKVYLQGLISALSMGILTVIYLVHICK